MLVDGTLPVAESGANSATGNAAASTRVQRASVSIMLSPSDRDNSPGARVAGAAECRFCDITGADCPGRIHEDAAEGDTADF